MIIKVSIEQSSIGLNTDSVVREKMIVLNFGSQIVVDGSVIITNSGSSDSSGSGSSDSDSSSGSDSSSDSSSGSSSGSTSLDWDDITDKPSFADVAYSGSYNDLSNKPSLSDVAYSGSYNDLLNTPSSALDSDGYAAKALTIKDNNGSAADKKIWTGTDTEYDELGEWDSNTLYFVL